MFTIQYEDASGAHRMQELDSRSRPRLVRHLANYNRPIVAVYEQASPITKAVRKQLADYPGGKTQHAAAFANSPV